MVETSSRKRLILPMAPIAGAVVGLGASAIFALIPGDLLGRLILRSGLPAILAAAEPPLGVTARLVLILLGGSTIGLLTWFALFLLLGSRTMAVGGDPIAQEGEAVPVLRRADAHPDAPSRRPVFANRDLGTPFLEVRAPDAPAADTVSPPLPLGIAPNAIPADLNLPLAAFDRAAIRPHATHLTDQPAPPPPPPVKPPTLGRQIFDVSERFETFALTTPAPANDTPPPPPKSRGAPRDTNATINALLERLERGVSDRAMRAPVPMAPQVEPARLSSPPRAEGLEQTLNTLRRMAMRG